jgi:hypothetical protein
MSDQDLAKLLRAAAERLDGKEPRKRESKAEKAERETKEKIMKKKLARSID